jgi:signal transduction histidine kinase
VSLIGSELLIGIAHDLRNVVLFPIGARVDLLRRALWKGDVVGGLALIEELASMVQLGEDTVGRLISGQPARSTADIDELASRALALASDRVGPTTSVTLTTSGGGTILVDVAAVVAALVNLIVNAIDAVAPNGGAIEVRTGTDSATAWFEVVDDGPGIDAETRGRLFTPLFTTKVNGVGIGLAMVARCVRDHRGSVDVASTPGSGTRFTLRFPRA